MSNERFTVQLLSGPPAGDPVALIADGDHGRVDAYVSLAVIASALAIAAGAAILDPVIGLGMTAVILRITRESWRTVRGYSHP